MGEGVQVRGLDERRNGISQITVIGRGKTGPSGSISLCVPRWTLGAAGVDILFLSKSSHGGGMDSVNFGSLAANSQRDVFGHCPISGD